MTKLNSSTSSGASVFLKKTSFLFLVITFSLCSVISCFAADKPSPDNIVVATVNSERIFKSSVDFLVAQYMERSGSKEVTIDQKKEILRSLITRHLILQNPEAQALKNDEIIFKKTAMYENNLIVTKFVKERVDSNIEVTAQEVTDFYKNNINRYRNPEKIKVRGMLLKTRDEALNMMSRLKKGEDFTALAKENSIDLATARSGGKMEDIIKGSGKVFPEIEEALFKLKGGELSDIVRTDFGFNIFLVEQVIPASVVPLDDVKGDISKALLQNKKIESFDLFSKNIQKGADIKVFENQL